MCQFSRNGLKAASANAGDADVGELASDDGGQKKGQGDRFVSVTSWTLIVAYSFFGLCFGNVDLSNLVLCNRL